MKFYRVKFDDIFLTKDGTNSAIPAKLQVVGADALLSPFTGSTIISIDGTPVNQVFEVETKGRTLEVRVETYLLEPVWESIVELINDRLADGGTINVVGAGDVGDFDVDAKPLLPRPFEAQEFENERILKPIFRFITV